MLSDRTHPPLNALADGELSLWAAARARRHLKTCPACRAEYEAILTLGTQARAWRDAAAPATLEARLTEVITRLSTHPEDITMPTTATLPTAIPPAPPRVALRWHALAGAGAFVALLAAGALLLPGSPGHPTVAFADVRRAMADIDAVSWTQEQTRFDLDGHMTLHNTQQFWVRRDQPAIAEVDSASTVPQVEGGEYAGPTRSLSDAHGQVNAHIRDGVYYLHPPDQIARRVQGSIDDLTASPTPDSPWRAEQTTLLGRPALVFRQHIHMLTDRDEPERRTIDGSETFWADPHTLRVLRHRSDIVWGAFRAVSDDGTARDLPAEHIVLDAGGFEYDQPAPPSVFDLPLPANARVTEDDGKGNETVVAASARVQ